jgi:hypothetical protein
MARGSPILKLKLGQEIFSVKKTRLLEKLGLFQDHPSLFASDSYEVRTPVSQRDFQAFLDIVEGGTITVSQTTCEIFSLLAREFRFEVLSAACAAFEASAEPICESPTNTEDSDMASGFAEVSQASKPPVTIIVPDHCRTYEAFDSVSEVDAFVDDLAKATERGILIKGLNENDRLVERAVENVYFNTVAKFPDDYFKNPFLALILWKLHKGLYPWAIESSTDCLRKLNNMAPTSCEKALLLLLSQCDASCYGRFVPLPTADRNIITFAIRTLEHEDNGQMDFAAQLLKLLQDSRRYTQYSFESGMHRGRRQVYSPSGPGEVASAQGDGARTGPGVEDLYQRAARPVIRVVDANSGVFHDPTRAFNFRGRPGFPGMWQSSPGPGPGQYATMDSNFEHRRNWCGSGISIDIGSGVPSPITDTTGCPRDFPGTSPTWSGNI